ncbi:MAG: hypothetical protein P8181_15305, partial [bacterium]
ARGMTSRAVPPPLEHRLVFVSFNLSADAHVVEFRSIVERAADHGYNGIVFDGSFDRIDLRDTAYFERLKTVKSICDRYDMELIPLVFSAGYAGATLAHDRNLAAGLPVMDVPFSVGPRTARLEGDPKTELVNGDFSRYAGDKVSGFDLQEKPGVVTVVDTKVSHDGPPSLRFENFNTSRDGKARLMQKVDVRPFRCYRLTLWVKTEDLEPADRFQVQVIAPGGRVLMMWSPRLERSQDWNDVTVAFNTLDYDRVSIWLGVWRGIGGRFWVDDVQLGEIGVMNALRRPGTPITVRNRDTGARYDEGADFEFSSAGPVSYEPDSPELILEVVPSGGIHPGDRLAVDYYQGLAMKRPRGQTSVCLSEPETYGVWRDIARLVHEYLDPDYYFLSMDEIRQGGWCAACEARGLEASELIGRGIARQVEIIRGVSRDAQIFVWSDMLDPNQNARADFYLFKGDIYGSWEYIPKDLIIACWKSDICDKSLTISTDWASEPSDARTTIPATSITPSVGWKRSEQPVADVGSCTRRGEGTMIFWSRLAI